MAATAPIHLVIRPFGLHHLKSAGAWLRPDARHTDTPTYESVSEVTDLHASPASVVIIKAPAPLRASPMKKPVAFEAKDSVVGATKDPLGWDANICGVVAVIGIVYVCHDPGALVSTTQ